MPLLWLLVSSNLREFFIYLKCTSNNNIIISFLLIVVLVGVLAACLLVQCSVHLINDELYFDFILRFHSHFSILELKVKNSFNVQDTVK